MATTFTPNLNLEKPQIAGDEDVWGNKSNGNWDKVDTAAKTMSDAIARVVADVAGLPAAINAASFPAGTRLLFQQSTAPTGWTKDTTHNDKALRVVSGAAGSAGALAFTTAFANRSVAGTTDAQAQGGTVHDHVLNIDQIPQHIHGFNDMGGAPGNAGKTGIQYGNGGSTFVFQYHSTATGPAGSGLPHSHGFTPSSHSHGLSASVDLRVQYVDVIIATKD